MKESSEAQTRMHDHARRTLDGLFPNAERDVRLARAERDQATTAKAQDRLETLRAALGIYAASHLVGHGERPWSREVRR